MLSEHHRGDTAHRSRWEQSAGGAPIGVSPGTGNQLPATTVRNGNGAGRWPDVPRAGTGEVNRGSFGQRGPAVLPRSGDVLRVTRSASVQFTSPLLFRVIRVHDWTTYDGWVWLDGYELNAAGEAVDRRSIFVQVGGLQQVRPPGLDRSRVRQPVG